MKSYIHQTRSAYSSTLRGRTVAKLGPGHSAQTGCRRGKAAPRAPLMLLAAQMYDALGVPAHPRATTAPTIRPEQLPSSANRSFYKQRILQAETCGLDAAYSTSAKFNVSKCAHIEVSTLSEGQSCEDFYSREHLFTICRSRDTANPLTCESGVTFSWLGAGNQQPRKRSKGRDPKHGRPVRRMRGLPGNRPVACASWLRRLPGWGRRPACSLPGGSLPCRVQSGGHRALEHGGHRALGHGSLGRVPPGSEEDRRGSRRR